MAGRSWLQHPALTPPHVSEVRTRLGISPNHPSFRIGVLRTHLLTALIAHAAAEHTGTSARVMVRWDDTDTARSRNEYRPRLQRELQETARIPIAADTPGLRQSRRGRRYREALARLAALGLLRTSRGVVCLDVPAIDRLITRRGQRPEDLVAAVLVNSRAPLTPAQSAVPLARGDGRALWHLASVVDDIDTRTTLVVRGTDKASATAIQARLHWALNEATPAPAHVFVPRIIERDRGASRVAALLDQGIRPSALRWFLTEPYLTPALPAPPETFTDLLATFRPVLPANVDSRFDVERLTAMDRKISARLSTATALSELHAATAHSRGSATAAHITHWIATRYRRPLRRQVQLLQSLTRTEIDYGRPPQAAEEAFGLIDTAAPETIVAAPAPVLRWVLTGDAEGPDTGELVALLPRALIERRIVAAGQALSSAKAARNRASVRSRPSSATDSNSGKPTVRPVTATRTGA
ncbi:glutamyl/glutaminyl-tRNA synthetase [Murinocardiopsis flavida]|uniref:Glutamyl/glutaminyl-tRNA synthetase n=1 Tax=Murinocardiopsis flavida TaxID=645275 RepID=A0A2P8CLW9_9ACTN|nr:glutamyl/glutaminyl-tRNA synthetase [Murinocardiopsis flavida]